MMDTRLDGINSNNAFPDDIMIISKGTLEKYLNEIEETLERLDNENLAISLHKCQFGLTEITWLGYKINSEGIRPPKWKTEAIIQWQNPKTLKQLRSFMGSIHHLVRFIPNLASLSATFTTTTNKINTNTIYKTTKQSTYSPTTPIKTNTRLPTLRQ